jgi:predicted phosphodiesterase
MSLIFIGDIHQNWMDVEAGLMSLSSPPKAAVLLGDIECTIPLDSLAAPLLNRGVAVYWIHGNHDYDAGSQMWTNLAEPGCNPLTAPGALHGRVLDIQGVRVAGLGGVFLPQVWPARAPPRVQRRSDLGFYLAATRPELDAAGLASLMHFLDVTAIWPEDLVALSSERADVLVTHEAPSSHPEGIGVLDELARTMGAHLIVHGHHHVTSSATAEDGLRVLGVGDTWAVDLDGHVVWRGRKRRRPLPRPSAGWIMQSTAA